MTVRTTYSIHKNQTQEDLNRIAKKIFENGEIVDISHHGYSTNFPEQSKDGEMVYVEDGSLCIEVTSKILPITFFVHLTGTTVYEIIENIER